jgi:hypothetical protein
MEFALCVHFIIHRVTRSRPASLIPPSRLAMPSGGPWVMYFHLNGWLSAASSSRQIPVILTALFKWKNQFEAITCDQYVVSPSGGTSRLARLPDSRSLAFSPLIFPFNNSPLAYCGAARVVHVQWSLYCGATSSMVCKLRLPDLWAAEVSLSDPLLY